jgi:hypothetical protein
MLKRWNHPDRHDVNRLFPQRRAYAATHRLTPQVHLIVIGIGPRKHGTPTQLLELLGCRMPSILLFGSNPNFSTI